MFPHRLFLALRQLHHCGLVPRGHSWLLHWLACLFWSHRMIKVDMPDGGTFTLDASDRGQASYFFHFGLPNEQIDFSILRAAAREFSVIFDIGAHIGFYTRLFALSAPASSVHAFEASENAFELLTLNLSGHPHAKLNRLAVAKMAGKRTFYLHPSSDLSSLLTRSGVPTTIDTTSLDDYCKKNSIPVVDFIKCDVEGAELEVILGARELLSSEYPPLWLVENPMSQHNQDFGYTERTIADTLKTFSSQPFHFFHVVQKGENIFAEECNPESISWKTVGANIWIVPERWNTTFFHTIENANLSL